MHNINTRNKNYFKLSLIRTEIRVDKQTLPNEIKIFVDILKHVFMNIVKS